MFHFLQPLCIPGIWDIFPSASFYSASPSVPPAIRLLPFSTWGGNWKKKSMFHYCSLFSSRAQAWAKGGGGGGLSMFCMVFQSRARLWTSHPGLAAILPIQQVIYQGPLNHLHPGTECIPVQMLQSCNPFGVFSLPCVGMVSQGKETLISLPQLGPYIFILPWSPQIMQQAMSGNDSKLKLWQELNKIRENTQHNTWHRRGSQ